MGDLRRPPLARAYRKMFLLRTPLTIAHSRTFSFGEIQMLSSLSHYDHVVTLPFPSRLHHIEHCVLSILRTGHCSRGEPTIVRWHQRGTNDGFISAKAIAPARLRRDTLKLIYYLSHLALLLNFHLPQAYFRTTPKRCPYVRCN